MVSSTLSQTKILMLCMKRDKVGREMITVRECINWEIINIVKYLVNSKQCILQNTASDGLKNTRLEIGHEFKSITRQRENEILHRLKL